MVARSVYGKVVVTIRADTFRLDKAINRVKHTVERLDWLVWSSSGWRRCFRPFVMFHFWWTKPV